MSLKILFNGYNSDYELSPYFQKSTLAFYFIVKLVSVQCIAYELQWIDITGSNQEQISLTFFIRKQTTVIKSLAKKMIALNFFYYYIYVSQFSHLDSRMEYLYLFLTDLFSFGANVGIAKKKMIPRVPVVFHLHTVQ